MANLNGLGSIVSELKAERTSLASQLKQVDMALGVLGKMRGGSNHAKPSHAMSAAGRRRISLAQKRRWAKVSGQAPKSKHKISAAGRKRIAAAARARWAKFRAVKKK